MLTLLTAIITIIRWLEYETELKDYPIGDLYLVKPIQKYTICNYIFILSIPICEIYLLIVRCINKLFT